MPRGADQGLGLLGDGADDGDVDAVDVERGVLREDRVGRALGVDVRAEVVPRRVAAAGRADDAVAQVGAALVELVVAHGRGVEAERVEHVDRRLVLLHRGGELRGADQVTGTDEEGVCPPCPR